MKRYLVPLLIISLALVLLMAACADDGDPAMTVMQFFQAKVESDEDALRGLLCSAMEADLAREAASFRSVQAELENVSCARGDAEGDFTIVTCEGQISALYGTETREFPLTSYRTVQEDGEWKYCGEN